MNLRARQVWVRLFARTAEQQPTLGQGVTEAMLVSEVENELEEVRAAHAIELAVMQAALNEARSRATQTRPVLRTIEQWKEALSAMPPLASHEIEAWNGAVLRKMAYIGTTQDWVIIARLCEMLLRPYRETPNADPA